MPTAVISKPIAVTFSSAVTAGSKVKVLNRTTGEVMTTPAIQAGSTTYLLFDCQNFADGYTTNDVIELRIVSSNCGQATVTLTADTAVPQEVTMTVSDAPAGAGRGI